MSLGWYLVFTKPHQEKVAKVNLQRQGFDIYLPLLQQHKLCRNQYKIVTESLFPRYLFIHLNAETSDWSKIRSTRGCISLVRFDQYPARVPDSLVQHLRNNEASRLIESNTTMLELKPGDKVKIWDGPFMDYEGIIKMKNSQERLILLLKISENHMREVIIPIHQVKKMR